MTRNERLYRARERLNKAIDAWTARVAGSYGDGRRAAMHREKIDAQRILLEKAIDDYRLAVEKP